MIVTRTQKTVASILAIIMPLVAAIFLFECNMLPGFAVGRVTSSDGRSIYVNDDLEAMPSSQTLGMFNGLLVDGLDVEDQSALVDGEEKPGEQGIVSGSINISRQYAQPAPVAKLMSYDAAEFTGQPLSVKF